MVWRSGDGCGVAQHGSSTAVRCDERERVPVLRLTTVQKSDPHRLREVWWSNITLFCTVHVVALYTILYTPFKLSSLFVCYINWQLATLGITLGYHRYWSHKSYSASPTMRIILAALGTMGFQGSIKYNFLLVVLG